MYTYNHVLTDQTATFYVIDCSCCQCAAVLLLYFEPECPFLLRLTWVPTFTTADISCLLNPPSVEMFLLSVQ